MRIYKILQAGKYHDDNFREALFRRRRSIWARSQVPADITEKNPEIYQLIFDHFQNDLMTFINLIINISVLTSRKLPFFLWFSSSLLRSRSIYIQIFLAIVLQKSLYHVPAWNYIDFRFCLRLIESHVCSFDAKADFFCETPLFPAAENSCYPRNYPLCFSSKSGSLFEISRQAHRRS